MIPFHPTHTVTISRRTFSASADNGRGGSGTATNVYTDLICELREATGNEAVIYGGDRTVSFGTAKFQAGVTLQESDRIVVTGEDPREITKVSVRRRSIGLPYRVDCEWRRVQS